MPTSRQFSRGRARGSHLGYCLIPLVVSAALCGIAPPSQAQEAAVATEGRLMRVIDAVPLRGEDVRLRLALRAELSGVPACGAAEGGCDPGAYGWLRIDGPPAAGTGKERRTLPVAAEAWTVEEIRVEVPPDALEVHFGVMLAGEGRMWADDIQLARRLPDGTWRRLRLENADCESVLEGGRPAAWGGIEPPYRASIDRDAPYEGSGAIRIERIAPGPDGKEGGL
jgi:hypothetical protein